MSENTSEWKFRTKRERQRLVPYSRPNNDSRSERIVNNLNNNAVNNSNSLLNRISTGFKDLFIPNWLRNTLYNSSNNNIDNSTDNSSRNQISSNNQINLNINAANSTNEWDSTPRLTPFTNNWNPINTSRTDTNPNDYLSKPSTSSTIFATNDDVRQSTTSTSELKPQAIDVTEADDRSSSSSATASSTSGCSSLVPSHSDHVLRLGLPLETMRKELAKVKTRESMTANDSIQSKVSIVEQKRVNPYYNNNNNRRQFSVNKFMSPSSVLPQKSPFYDGKTVFGGANVSRAARLAGTTPYALSSRHSLAPIMKVQINDKRRIDSSDQLSTSTMKILEKLEKASTPIQDAKRIPLYSESKNYFQSQKLLGSTKRQRVGPPITSILTPSIAKIDQRVKPIKWELTPVMDNKEKSGNNDKLINICDNNSSINSKKIESNENKVSEGGGKITRKDNKRTTKEDLADESVEVALANVTPLTIPSGISLPKFDFGNSSSFQKQSLANKTLPTTTLTKVEDESTFKFSLPTLKKREKTTGFDTKDESVVSTPFTFSSPKGVITQTPSIKLDFSQIKNSQTDSNKARQSEKPIEKVPQLNSDKTSSENRKVTEEKSPTEKNESKEEKWVCSCLYYNNAAENKCKACNTERGSKPLAESKNCELKMSWGDKFKAPEGSWSCDVCLINNSSDKTKCAACETPKPGLQITETPKDSIKSSSGSWQCYYCKQHNDVSKTVCISCDKVKTAIATKADLDKLYSGQTFKFGFTGSKSNSTSKEAVNDNVVKDSNDSVVTNPLFLKPSETSSQIADGNPTPFTFGSTQSTKLTVEPKASTTSTTDSLFKFGLPTTKPNDPKPTESSTLASTQALPSNTTSSLFQFGAQSSTTSSSIVPEFKFGSQTKPKEEPETKKSVSFSLEKKVSETSKSLETTNKLQSEPSFQLNKPTEEKSQLFSFGSNTATTGFGSTFNTSIFGSNTSAISSSVTTTTVSQPTTTSLSSTFNPLSNVTPNKNITSLFSLPNTTSSSSTSTPLSLFTDNKFNTGLKTAPVTTTSSQEVGKNLFSFGSSTIKPFDTLIPTNKNERPTSSSSTVTPTTSSSTNNLVFGNSNTNLQSVSSIAANVAPKPNFSFNANANNSHEETSLSSNKLFGSSNTSKTFAFGNAPLSNPETGFSFSATSTNPAPLSSSTFSFGLTSNSSNSNNNNNNNTNNNNNNNNNSSNDNIKPSTNSLFTFGQNSEQFSSSIAPKPNNTNISSPQFNFGVNQNTGQNNTSSIFGNTSNPSQGSLSFNQPTAPVNTPFSFGANFGATQSTPSVPSLQAQPSQQPFSPPQYNFSQQPTFDFARMSSPANQSSNVFQFSAEIKERNIKKAKRRLHPT